ncbi:MAG: DUF1684 domain-containing protein [Ignavibacteriales bacterium]|nr:DUF1684 domain-containing protein [Ignavibacteriales bacterium]
MKKFIILFCISILFFTSCGKKYSTEEREYINKIEKIRMEKDYKLKNDPDSPFNLDPKAHLEPLKYFDVDPEFVFKSRLFEYQQKDTLKIYGTKGDYRKVLKFGYVNINYKSKNYKINVYKGTTTDGLVYFTIWFTDKTTNKETYGVGRYISFEKNDDANYVYTIDFNLAHNPFCAYCSLFSCAIPTKEDYIALAIDAGEKKFHE